MRRPRISVHRPDLVLLVAALVLVVFGVIMVYDASVVAATRDFGDKFHFVKDHLTWVVIGLVGMAVASVIPYHVYRRLAVPIAAGTLIALILVFLPGIGIKAYGANRWLNLGLTSFQPSEVAKLALVIFMAAWLERKEDLKSFVHGFLPLLVILGVLGTLLILEPDMGTFLIIALVALGVYFAAGARIIFYVIGIPAAFGTFLIIALTSTYRKARLLTFLDPTSDTQGTSYHINQILLSLGSGGLFGTGIGQSRGKFEYIPEVSTDSIFAVIGEELGYVGSVALIVFYGFFLYRAFKIAQNAPDRFGQLLALGITLIIAVQTALNLAAIVALAPLTGVPLPLISYGGSNLVMTMIGIGILLNISASAKVSH